MAICFVLALSGRYRRSEGFRTAEVLRSIVAADARFLKVKVSCSTNGRVLLYGTVASPEDLQTLRTLVERSSLPRQPGISVEVVKLRPI